MSKEEKEGIFVLMRGKGLPLGREEADVDHRQKEKSCVRMRSLILIGQVNLGGHKRTF